jgi:hypothetical protein
MPVNQNIQNFYRTAAARDFSRDFLFRVTDMKLAGVPAMTPDQLIYAKAASVPGRTIGNITAPYMGLPLNIPGSVTYNSSSGYNLKFYLDGESELRTYFEAASRNLFDDATSTGAYGTPASESFIDLSQLDKQLEIIATYRLIGASIRQINDIQYTMADGTGTTREIDVTIAYHYYIDPRREVRP